MLQQPPWVAAALARVRRGRAWEAFMSETRLATARLSAGVYHLLGDAERAAVLAGITAAVAQTEAHAAVAGEVRAALAAEAAADPSSGVRAGGPLTWAPGGYTLVTAASAHVAAVMAAAAAAEARAARWGAARAAAPGHDSNGHAVPPVAPREYLETRITEPAPEAPDARRDGAPPPGMEALLVPLSPSARLALWRDAFMDEPTRSNACAPHASTRFCSLVCFLLARVYGRACLVAGWVFDARHMYNILFVCLFVHLCACVCVCVCVGVCVCAIPRGRAVTGACRSAAAWESLDSTDDYALAAAAAEGALARATLHDAGDGARSGAVAAVLVGATAFVLSRFAEAEASSGSHLRGRLSHPDGVAALLLPLAVVAAEGMRGGAAACEAGAAACGMWGGLYGASRVVGLAAREIVETSLIDERALRARVREVDGAVADVLDSAFPAAASGEDDAAPAAGPRLPRRAAAHGGTLSSLVARFEATGWADALRADTAVAAWDACIIAGWDAVLPCVTAVLLCCARWGLPGPAGAPAPAQVAAMGSAVASAARAMPPADLRAALARFVPSWCPPAAPTARDAEAEPAGGAEAPLLTAGEGRAGRARACVSLFACLWPVLSPSPVLWPARSCLSRCARARATLIDLWPVALARFVACAFLFVSLRALVPP